MFFLIDYLSVSFTRKMLNLDVLIELLNIPLEKFEHLNKYYFDYHYIYYYNGIKIWLSDEKILLDISGKGCRALESYGLDNWVYLFMILKDIKATFNRIDIACDVKDTLPYEKVKKDYDLDKYMSNSQHIIDINGSEQAIYFGSPKSKKRLRIYNKALERGVSENWVRFELQLRNEMCLTFTESLEEFNIPYIFGGMLQNTVKFITKSYKGINSNWFNLSTWYKQIIQDSEKIKNVIIGGLEYNLEHLEKIIKKQYASTIITYLKANDGDLSSILDLQNGIKHNHKQKVLLDNLKKVGI